MGQMMKIRWAWIALLFSPMVLADVVPAMTPAGGKPGGFTLSKETTYIVAPVKTDGRPDYIAFLNAEHSRGVTPENNAVVAILAVTGIEKATGKVGVRAQILKNLGIAEPPPATYEYLYDYVRKHGTPAEQADSTAEDTARSSLWNAKQFPVIAAWLKENDASLDQLAEATKRPRYYWPLVSDSPHEIASIATISGLGLTRGIANAWDMRALLRLNSGDVGGAMHDIQAMHRMAALLRQGPSLIDKLIAVAIASNAADRDADLAGKMDSAIAKDYLRHLKPSGEETVSSSVDQLERFMLLDNVLCVRLYGTDILKDEVFHGKEDDETVAKIDLKNVDMDEMLKLCNKQVDRFVAAIRRPGFSEWKSAMEEEDHAISERFAEAKNSQVGTEQAANLMMGVVLPSLARARVLEDASRERSDLGRLAVALTAYRGDHGAYPKTLDSLAPDYVEKVPVDLFSDAPLKYRLEGNGYVLYSVSKNQKDDGGVASKHVDTGDLVVKQDH